MILKQKVTIGALQGWYLRVSQCFFGIAAGDRMELIMVFDNLAVNHKSFGRGVVVSYQGKYMTVKFDSVQKIFVYPDAFENFLTLEDGTVSDEIRIDIDAVKRAKQVILDKKKEENIRAMTKGIVIPGKEGALNEPDEEENQYKNQEIEEI